MKFRTAAARFGAAAAAGLLTFGLAACNDEDGGDASEEDDGSGEETSKELTPTERVDAALEVAQTETYTATMTVNEDWIVADMEVDPANEAAAGTMSIDGAAMAEAAGEDPAGMTDLEFQTVTIGEENWVKLGGMEALGIDPDTWIHVSAEDGAKLMEDMGGGPGPEQTVQNLIDSLDQVEETEDGTYTGVMTQDGEEIDVELTLDDEGRLQTLSMETESEGTPMNVEMEYGDYGGDVEITEPPADQVEEYDDLMGG